MNGTVNFRLELPTGSQEYDVVPVQGETYTKASFKSVHESGAHKKTDILRLDSYLQIRTLSTNFFDDTKKNISGQCTFVSLVQ